MIDKRKSKLILFNTALLLLMLIIVELVMRNYYRPGDLKPKWLNFHPVDSLYVIHDFYTNDDGLLVADSPYWAQRKVYINSDGFRSKGFSQMDSTKKKILFIGDSFTWGMSASPFQNNCFTDLIRNETAYEVINLGIPAADPPQYLELAKKYVPLLKPDLVFVIFFAGNDIMKEDRQVIPGEPFYYYTNAGAILADIDGIHFKSAQAAYNYFVNDRYYLHQPKNALEWVISKSSLLSRLYSMRYRIREKLDYENTLNDTRITKEYLRGIQQVCRNIDIPLKFVLIPEIKEADLSLEKYTKKYGDLLSDDSLRGEWLLMANSKDNFNDYPDAHLNNRGHRVYADYLKLFLHNYFE